MAERASFLRNRKVWIVALALVGAIIGFALAIFVPHHADSGDSGSIGGFVAAYAGLMAAVSAAAARRRRSKENADG